MLNRTPSVRRKLAASICLCFCCCCSCPRLSSQGCQPGGIRQIVRIYLNSVLLLKLILMQFGIHESILRSLLSKQRFIKCFTFGESLCWQQQNVTRINRQNHQIQKKICLSWQPSTLAGCRVMCRSSVRLQRARDACLLRQGVI